MQLVVNIIGAGKIGQTIGRLLVENNLAKIAGVCNKTLESAMAAIEFMGDGIVIADIPSLPLADITFITVPDDRISDIGLQISHTSNIKPNSIYVHCSGVLTSDVLAAVKINNVFVASCHPMKSFSDPLIAYKNYPGTYCAMEGDTQASEILTPLFQSFGSQIFSIEKDKKPLYHAAGVFASNYLITLAQQSLNCFTASGVEEKIALQMIIGLMQSALINLKNTLSPTEALTGPIQRGDISTIQKHLAAISDSQQRNLYALLGQFTIPCTTHHLEIKSQLAAALLLEEQ